MAKPELKNGYTQIANEILEHLMAIHLAPNQWQVLLCIIRKTYGFQKKVDYIANSQIVDSTGLCKAVVSRTLRSLKDMNIITRNGKHLGFQKDWERWQKLAVSSTSQELAAGSKLAEQSTLLDSKSKQYRQQKLAISSSTLAISSTKVSSPAVAQKKKETITKETIQKKEAPKKKYGEFNNVLLTNEEYQKLISRFGESGANDRIETLSVGIASKGYRYKEHYATILAWERGDEKKAKNATGKPGSPPAEGKHDGDPDKYVKGKYGHMVQR